MLIFNWGDIKNPSVGEDEIYTHEIGNRLIKKGHKAINGTIKK